MRIGFGYEYDELVEEEYRERERKKKIEIRERKEGNK